jgi:hypothetical protein
VTLTRHSAPLSSAIVGVSLEAASGTYAIELKGEIQPGKTPGKKVTFTRKFAVAQGKYPKIEVELNVESKFTEPTAERKEIEEGQQIKKDHLGRVTPERAWSGRFAAPAEVAISDVFGSERIFNGATTARRDDQLGRNALATGSRKDMQR